MNEGRRIPAVGVLLELAPVRALLARASRPVVVDAVRAATHRVRTGEIEPPGDDAGWAALIDAAIDAAEVPSLRRVLNGTGVVLHTNLGRAPLAQEALEAIGRIACGGTNLEYDLASGTRGSRDTHATGLLTELTGAEDALLVNNCAAALVLSLAALGTGRDAIISRGELIEIGGSFRVPAIMATSGARLREVGTTNRTHLEDYRAAIGRETAVLLKVHRSNFVQQGYVAEAPLRELSALARQHSVPLVHDFGSGLMLDLAPWGLRGEPTAADVLRDGVDLVVMSGDKLLGGPQAGILLGSKAVVGTCRRHPLARAMRVDKLRIAAMEATLRLYRDPALATSRIPVLRMLTTPAAGIHARATHLANGLRARGWAADVVPSTAAVGGGAFPTAELESWAVACPAPAAALEAALRHLTLPLIARVIHDRVQVDLRSIDPAEDADVMSALHAACEQTAT